MSGSAAPCSATGSLRDCDHVKPAAIIFDFDGVIADSEIVSGELLGRTLTQAGLPTSLEEAMDRYTGLNRIDTLAAIATHWGAQVPHDIADRLAVETTLAFSQPLRPVDGIIDFLARVDHLPRAIASSSSTGYIRAHLGGFGLNGRFGEHIYSGREHVTRGKPFPDLYLHAAAALGIAIGQALVIEDSPVGARAGVAAGARVFGIAAASHARPKLSDALLAEGVERVFSSYTEMAEALAL